MTGWSRFGSICVLEFSILATMPWVKALEGVPDLPRFTRPRRGGARANGDGIEPLAE